MITDPKALNYILHKVPHHFQWTPEMRGITRLLNGEGLVSAEGSLLNLICCPTSEVLSLGAVHARQRRVMSPGFSASEAKALLPVFRRWAIEVSKRS
jgi:cytochrome P450